MIVKCINSSKHGLGLEYGFEPINLEVSKEYKVYGIEIIGGHTIVYISDTIDPFYPSRYSLHHFEVISNKLSKYWELEVKEGSIKLFISDWLNFPDFLNFYINSTEADLGKYPIISFHKMKKKIDQERE